MRRHSLDPSGYLFKNILSQATCDQFKMEQVILALIQNQRTIPCALPEIHVPFQMHNTRALPG
jgi:hypothetical protein